MMIRRVLLISYSAVAVALPGCDARAVPRCDARAVLRCDAPAAPQPDYFPEALRGGAWRLAEAPRVYAGQQLFELIDGGAPLYFEYGFEKAIAARYVCRPGGEVAVECYAMRTAEGAWGLWSYLSAGAGGPVMLGDTAVAGTGFLLVCDREHLWSFTVLDSLGRDSLLVLAGALVEGDSRSVTIPPLVREFAALFPGARDPVLFFGPLGLQKRGVVVPERWWKIPRGVSAGIVEGEVLLLEYRSAQEAGIRLDSLGAFLRMQAVRTADGTLLAGYRSGVELLAGRWEDRVLVLSGPDRGRLQGVWRRFVAGVARGRF